MGLVEMLMRLRSYESSIERVEQHSSEVRHDLTNIRARLDVISRLVMRMREDGSQRQ